MLEILRLPRRSAAVPLMDSFEADQSTWIVSDLRSKHEFQHMLLEKNGGYLDTSVLRASDLWKLLLRRARPEIQLVSRDFVRSLIRSFLSEHGTALGYGPSSERSVLAAMDRFAPVVFHERGDELMEEWFSENPASKEKWGANYLLARVALKRLLADQMIVAKWAPAVLQTEPDFERHWDLPLIVDLGTELGTAEAQLFLRLSKRAPVTVLEPDPAWRGESEAVLRAYRDIEGAATRTSRLKEGSAPEGRRLALRVSGQLAEVKTAVATARRWLDDGVAPHEIAILAPEIEEYWPVLKAYLDEEGIPADKPVAVKLNSYPSLSRWLARLRPKRGELTAADLELSFYSSDLKHRLRHEDFFSLFANLYGEEDLKRHAIVEDAFARGPQFGEKMNRDEFLMAAALLWDSNDPLAPLLKLAREIFQNAVPGTVFPLGEWIRYTEAVAASGEITIEEGRAGGVLVTNFSSAKTSRLRRRVFLGLTEEGLRKAERNPLPLSDIGRLSDLGFHLDHPDHGVLEFELRWLVESPSEEDIYVTGVSTFDGSIRAPASLWLKIQGAGGHGLAIPEPTRQDLVQQAAPEQWRAVRAWSEERLERLLRRLRVDLGDEEQAPIRAPLPAQLSPSLVTRYLDCPFEAATSVLFRLRDLEKIDLDLANSGLGTLTHAVFQAVTDGGWLSRPEISDEDIAALVTEKKNDLSLILAEESWWEPILKRQVRVVKEFIRVEKNWKANFPALQLLPSEQTWEIYFDPQTGHFQNEDGEGLLRIAGRVDRLETDGEGRFVVVDYKKSDANLGHQDDWLKKNELQLLFYMWALEKGALGGHNGEVIGAFYYVYRDFTRAKGFQIDEKAGGLFPPPSRKSKRSATVETKEGLFKELEEKISIVVKGLVEGEWAPHPREPEMCVRCKWTGLCRAPHLN